MCYDSSNISFVPWRTPLDSSTPLVVAVAASAGLSMFGSLFIIFTYCVWKDLHTTARRFLVCVSLSDFVNSCGNLVGVVANLPRLEGRGCEVQSVFTTFSSLGFIFWTTFLAVFLYMSIVQGKVTLTARQNAMFYVLGWGVPFAVTLGAFFSGALGNDNSTVSAGWCWTLEEPELPSSMTCENARLFWRLLTGKGWEVASYVAVPLLYILVHRHIRNESTSAGKTFLTQTSLQLAQRAHRKFAAIPMVYVLLRMWGTVRFFFDVFNMNEPRKMSSTFYEVFLYLHAVGDNAQGFANFIIFCLFTERIRIKMRSKVQSMCGELGGSESTQAGSPSKPLVNSGSHSPYLSQQGQRTDERTSLLNHSGDAYSTDQMGQ